jgi:hypothetical protein
MADPIIYYQLDIRALYSGQAQRTKLKNAKRVETAHYLYFTSICEVLKKRKRGRTLGPLISMDLRVLQVHPLDESGGRMVQLEVYPGLRKKEAPQSGEEAHAYFTALAGWLLGGMYEPDARLLPEPDELLLDFNRVPAIPGASMEQLQQQEVLMQRKKSIAMVSAAHSAANSTANSAKA